MVQRKKVIKLRDRYPWSSWAIWDDLFPDGDCIEKTPGDISDFIMEHLDELKAEVVLLGLNRSSDFTVPCVNFHAPTRRHYDYRLKELIQDGGLDNLYGAFMTDLVDEVDPDSSKITVTEEDADIFMSQLDLLSESEYHVICFGNKPFQGLVEYHGLDVAEMPHDLLHATAKIDGRTLNIYRAWFYGLYGANQSKVPVFRDQLRHLNNRIG